MIPKHIQQRIDKEAEHRYPKRTFQSTKNNALQDSRRQGFATALEKYLPQLLSAEELIEKMVKNAEAIKEWCKESGLKDCAIDNPVHMAVYHSMHLAKMIVDDINTYKKQSHDTTTP